MNSRTFVFSLLCLMLLIESCVMVPVPTKEDKVLAGNQVTDEQLSFLTAKITTKQEVIERLGNPNIIWEDVRVFVYKWDMRQGILFWAAGAHYQGAVGMNDIAKHYLLLIQFDEQGRILRFARMTRPLLEPYADFITEWVKNSPVQSPAEQSAVSVGEKVVVLLNVQCTVDNQPYGAFIKPTFTTEPIFLFGLGSFETFGELRLIGHRFLSEESRRAGWTYFLLSPGVKYLAVLGPDSSAIAKAGAIDSRKYFQEAPRWRIDVPQNVKLIYVGTLQFAGKSDGELLLGGKIIRPAISDEASIRDDHGRANSLLSEHFANAGEAKTILMQRWRRGDPIIIRSQKSGSTK
jgi:outer membrane protein assembly factor BamE (lipoprotein component of BamABCDE complex)